jgi:putative ABC transport system substrate-binding protein
MRFRQVKRRDFITLLGGAAAAWPLAARAQQSAQIRRVGMLIGYTENDPETQARLAAFRQAFEQLGWKEGRSVRIDYRFAPASPDQAQLFAKELIALQPDVIVAHTTPLTKVLQGEGRAIPIVFVNVADPVGAGFVDSLARPGGNITGLMLFEPSVIGKWLSMLKEIEPRLARAAFVINPKTDAYVHFVRPAEAMAASLVVTLVPTHVRNAAEIESAIDSFARVPNGGLVLPPDITTFANRDLIVTRAAQHRLPAVYSGREWLAAGGLMSYGTDLIVLFRQAGSYVDRILRGANPADLPVQAPTKYETIINLKTARALGLAVPPGLLVAADEVIE